MVDSPSAIAANASRFHLPCCRWAISLIIAHLTCYSDLLSLFVQITTKEQFISEYVGLLLHPTAATMFKVRVIVAIELSIESQSVK